MATLAELDTKQHVKKLHELSKLHADAFAKGERWSERGLFIGGAVGTGKSHCMFAIARECLLAEERRYKARIKSFPGRDHPDYDPQATGRVLGPSDTVAVLTFREFLYRLTQPDSDGNKFNVPAAVDKLCSARYVFMDDMTVRVNATGNAESPYRWAYDAVNELVDRIWSDNGNTLLYVTTNNKPTELASAFGDWCADRITGICEPVWITGASFR
ncbi:MAG: hypothetical protein WC107_07150 [Patescibacteria group bacterium]|jgi:DNA replication protein DnaC